MRIGIYNPYLHSLSGGERYTWTLASHWSKHHTVDVFWDDSTIADTTSKRFHIDLTRVRIVNNIFTHGLVQKLPQTRAYNLLLILSDGSIPISLAKHNILHFQVPFPRVDFPFWKRYMYQHIVCNSLFTKTHIDPSVGSRATVIYPPVDIGDKISRKKEKLILSVGRFSSYHQSKKQEVLLTAFQEGHKRGIFKGWRLILAGGLLPADKEYFMHLKGLIKNAPIELVANAPYSEIQRFYEQSSIYWHAAGYGETDPQLMEHFGITTVEAMAAGCIPVVYNGGGQKEIVTQGLNGYLWNTGDELVEYSRRLLFGANSEMQNEARSTSLNFRAEVFNKAFDAILPTL